MVHVDTEQARDELINSRRAYVSLSRGRYDAQIYTNDAQKLGEELSRDVSKQSALETGHGTGGGRQDDARQTGEHRAVGASHGQGQGHGMAH
jgi:hypothetical protein